MKNKMPSVDEILAQYTPEELVKILNEEIARVNSMEIPEEMPMLIGFEYMQKIWDEEERNN